MPQTVAILSPGDMGHAVGRVLIDSGHRVITCLEGRSARTRGLSEAAGIEDTGNLADMVVRADLVLSILVPSEAEQLAGKVAAAIEGTGAKVAFADCNAVSPATSARIGAAIEGAGGSYIDGSIIGPPPSRGAPPRLYVSGPGAGAVEALDGAGIVVRNMGPRAGAASAIKMCYAAFTKGGSALSVALLVTAERLGVSWELERELGESQAAGLSRMRAEIPSLPAKARRWVGEMEEIASTFSAAGLPPGFLEAAAEIYRTVGRTPMADETPEAIDESRGLRETVEEVARELS